MPNPIRNFLSPWSGTPEPNSAAVQLAHELTSDKGPTKGQVQAFKKAVGWRKGASISDAKVNYHAHQLLKRHLKQLSGEEGISAQARGRLEEHLATPPRLKLDHKRAKKALREQDGLLEQIHHLEERLADVERERDELQAQRERLFSGLLPFLAAAQETRATPQTPAAAPIGHARQGSRVQPRRPLSEFIFSRPNVPTDEVTQGLAHGTLLSDTELHHNLSDTD